MTMTNESLASLSRLPPERITVRLYELCAQERGLLVEFLAYLRELDKRRLYLPIGFSSTFCLLHGASRAHRQRDLSSHHGGAHDRALSHPRRLPRRWSSQPHDVGRAPRRPKRGETHGDLGPFRRPDRRRGQGPGRFVQTASGARRPPASAPRTLRFLGE